MMEKKFEFAPKVQDESYKDFLYATGYAWGRSDQGANHDANDIYDFGCRWVEEKSKGSHTSLQHFYSNFKWRSMPQRAGKLIGYILTCTERNPMDYLLIEPNESSEVLRMSHAQFCPGTHRLTPIYKEDA